MSDITTESKKLPSRSTAWAKNKVAEQMAKEEAKPQGPTIAEFILKPRPLMRGGRDVS
jgi:hypothetical protein